MRREPAVLREVSEVSYFNTPKVIDTGVLDDLNFRAIRFLQGEAVDQYSDGRNFYNLSIDERKEFARRIGKTLARVHESVEFESCGVLNYDASNLGGSSENWAEGIIDLQDWWHQRLKEEEGFEQVADRAEETLRENSEHLEEINDFRLLHMEFDLRNLLFQEDDIVVLDWEVAACGDPSLDYFMTEKRLIWREDEEKEVKKSLKSGYKSVRELDLSPSLKILYEVFQMTRFLLIFKSNDDMRERILERLDELFELVSIEKK